MNRHLEDHEIDRVLRGENLDDSTEKHLESCLSCRREVEQLGELVEARRDRLASEMPDWDHQRREVMARLPSAVAARQKARPRWLRPLLAAAAGVLVAVGLQTARAPAPPEAPVENEIQVEQILAEVDALLADDSLPGFEPIDPGVDDPESLFDNGAS
jgi:anti-sigma factor RsiW